MFDISSASETWRASRRLAEEGDTRTLTSNDRPMRTANFWESVASRGGGWCGLSHQRRRRRRRRWRHVECSKWNVRQWVFGGRRKSFIDHLTASQTVNGRIGSSWKRCRIQGIQVSTARWRRSSWLSWLSGWARVQMRVVGHRLGLHRFQRQHRVSQSVGATQHWRKPSVLTSVTCPIGHVVTHLPSTINLTSPVHRQAQTLIEPLSHSKGRTRRLPIKRPTA